MNQIICSYMNDLKDSLENMCSEDTQKKLILNIDNDTNEMLPLEELLEYLFDRYDYAKKHGYIKENFLEYMDTLHKIMHKIINGSHKNEEELFCSPKWKEAMSLAKDILSLPEAKKLFSICQNHSKNTQFEVK